MLASAALTFAMAGPELRALAIEAIRTHPQPPYGRPAYASGRTARELAEEHGEDFVQLTGPAHIQALITGRGPTKSSTAGEPMLREIIAQWARDKPGFELRPGQTYEGFGYVVARRIHEEGTALFRLGEPSGLFDKILSGDYLDTLKARIAAGEMVAITTALQHALGA
ncbi:MAG: hypothetical protein ACRYFV_01650 [Janthinobacterium lividum]